MGTVDGQAAKIRLQPRLEEHHEHLHSARRCIEHSRRMLEAPVMRCPFMGDISQARLVAEARSLRAQSKALAKRSRVAVECSRRLAQDFRLRLLLDESH